MFEKAKPVPHTQNARFQGAIAFDSDLLVGSVDTAPEVPGSGGGALRLIEWNELTARLTAARDLRLVLRRDTHRNIEDAGGSFADAAARYFRTREEGERDVNPLALEQCKGSPHITREHDGPTPPKARDRNDAVTRDDVTGDARED